MPKYADDFLEMMETWHAMEEKTDEKLDAEICRQQAEILERGKDWSLYRRLYFRPSSANACQRALYHQVIGDTPDERGQTSYQGRWQRIGTKIGELLQRDLLHIEKHYERRTGKKPPFVPERTPEGYPAWEEFVWGCVEIDYRGYEFSIIGEPDGILVHSDGRRVGLEIKSKQTSAARTSKWSMRTPEESHVKQAVNYAIMHDLDRYLIVYMNASKKSWNMGRVDYDKNPDFRVFELIITDEMKTAALDYYVDVLEAVDAGEPPEIDLTKWTFNGYKDAISKSIDEQELADLKAINKAIQRSGIPKYLKDSCETAIAHLDAAVNGNDETV